jgi:hypothetical protein
MISGFNYVINYLQLPYKLTPSSLWNFTMANKQTGICFLFICQKFVKVINLFEYFLSVINAFGFLL